MASKIELNQDALNLHHKMLDRLITATEDARVQACLSGYSEARDTLDKIGAHLRMARSAAGSLNFGGIKPQPRGGDK